jgi:hypothetical protein
MKVTRWTRLSAVWLVGMGMLVVGLAVYAVASSRWACDRPPEYSGYRFTCDVAWVVAAVAVVIAALHAMAAVSVWRGHVRGAVAGVVLSLLGSLTSSTFPACAVRLTGGSP